MVASALRAGGHPVRVFTPLTPLTQVSLRRGEGRPGVGGGEILSSSLAPTGLPSRRVQA